MGKFAVIDTETNWADQVMSIGTVLADETTFRPLETRYHIFPGESSLGGMYSHALFLDTPAKPSLCSRANAMRELLSWLHWHSVRAVFAYNAKFDRNHLPELGCFTWYDIMALAAYHQTNPRIPSTAELCATGRLKRGYGVEPMLRLLSGNPAYRETHNALLDALDELEILRLLGHGLSEYQPL